MSDTPSPDPVLAVATLGGGCFWCLEAVFVDFAGVHKVVSGYMGGPGANPSYEAVCSGRTGHAEVVQVHFDPQTIGFDQILDVFFTIHDPTQLNRQGNDRGTQYRSAIFIQDQDEADTAARVIQEVEQAGVWNGAVVTEVVRAREFWAAEPEHQDYLQRYPHGYTCHFIRPPWRKDTAAAE